MAIVKCPNDKCQFNKNSWCDKTILHIIKYTVLTNNIIFYICDDILEKENK